MVSYCPEEHGFEKKVPCGDDKQRYVCRDCDWVHYENPKIIVGAVCTWENKILMCRRGIEPRVGYWTIPAGFMEEGETAEQGAIREVFEESEARVQANALLAIYSIPRISQVQMFYRAEMLSPEIGIGIESLETRLFDWNEIPWNELAFPTVKWVLDHYQQSRELTNFAPFTVPADQVDWLAGK
ncbi:NADH pyrophosphatase [Polystyrenella longa]|uniref:NADH pyrophosphatase n=1 Tax=Polystyrenella longa TaxID=2528007 RepID=A0A518CI98_9PLAN|nr:NUDIX hydrolase [Polystyrenella longa]QDU78958.1 NADH pyrophosphatase [Polystyrenella longa]